jgi:hypothetical protein
MFAFLRNFNFRRRTESEIMEEYFSQATSLQHLETLMRNWDRGIRS